MQATASPPPAASQPGYSPTLSLKELSKTISALGIKKANTRAWQLFILGVLAGLYIGLGGQVSLVAVQQGLGKIVAGAVFSVGLVLVVVAGAELFTGNIIMVVGAMASLFTIGQVLRNWLAVYAGNFVGAFVLAALVWKSGLMGHANALNELGTLAASVAQAKLAQPFGEAVIRGILCNMLVVLAIIMATIAKDVVSKVVCCVLPIMVFVACGFEHCVANMYLIPLGLFAKGVPVLSQGIMFRNIIPVTIGNIIGGIIILVIHPNRIHQLVYLWKNRSLYRTHATQ